MLLNVGDMVTRNSYKNDIIFKIIKIENDIAYLKGIDLRLYADSAVDDLVKVENSAHNTDDTKIIRENLNYLNLNRDNYFYLPGKILHIDGDSDYLKRCMSFYDNMRVKAFGFCINENKMDSEILPYLEKYRPDILVITGHDAYYKKKPNKNELNNYQNTLNFIKTVKKAREFEDSQDKLIIIAGACQSNYEQLIKAGSNFASSPKRINIHALDPAIIATSIAFSEKNKSIDIIRMIEKTKYGSDGIGGIITNGVMYVGYPR